MDKRDTLAKTIWNYMLLHHTLQPMDAIFALGSNDVRVAKRAADLFLEGYGRYLICAGGYGKAAVFERPEAEVFAEVAIERGVPEKKIIREPNSTNTGENVLFTKKLLKEKELDLNSFILVQKPYMERRTYVTFRKQWSEAECIVTSPQLSFEEYIDGDEAYKKEVINLMVGDLQRIKEYPKCGFQIEQEIPDSVWGAWEMLVGMGYTKYYLNHE